MQQQSATLHVAPYPTDKAAFWTDYHCSDHVNVQGKECKRIRSLGYRIPHPRVAAAAYMKYFALLYHEFAYSRFLVSIAYCDLIHKR